ncbi:MAG: imidazole glycerol phosphate synthase subunit HisH, partial [Parasporobacterium sp.]|nr:imidazole glycerol phosphate synthase subunit HisH [Parasporobacterium sp.]
GELLSADRVILPGVGAFGDAMKHLEQYGLSEVIREAADAGIPFFGICLGMQLLFSSSEESAGAAGLSLLPGRILKIPDSMPDPQGGIKKLKIPHMGWNVLRVNPASVLFSGLEENPYVYFVHSYYLKADDPEIVAARTDYGVSIDAGVEYKNIFGCQFHPEKSSDTGRKILKNFLKL